VLDVLPELLLLAVLLLAPPPVPPLLLDDEEPEVLELLVLVELLDVPFELLLHAAAASATVPKIPTVDQTL
jgi:hypothetical protein